MAVLTRMQCHAVNETGGIPPGNAKGNTTWSIRRSAPKPELKLTPGKGLGDLTCSVEDLVDQVVKTNKVLSALQAHEDAQSALHVNVMCLSQADT